MLTKKPVLSISNSNDKNSNLTPQQQFLKENFRNQAALLSKTIKNTPSINNNINSQTQIKNIHNNSQYSLVAAMDNPKQTLLEAVYEECPFHNLKTEWYFFS
jgi:hypothetical protein